ncbi:uncharacterized protein LOC107272180 isoform X2 [Cephus cinctus]|uniref:Uncharacterized protein LOC107272180 isoform X2 n=1 Tax=Cephus cinctus TaxID=211228 RepID=A0AAJ7RQH8_CEPCN|nr:uncharacterized protein LOC107272180 isoform X2 [Cephus cinctus]
MNQQGPYLQSPYYQGFQSDGFPLNQQNSCQPFPHNPYNVVPSLGQNQQVFSAGHLPPNFADHSRPYLGNTAPVLIFPNCCPANPLSTIPPPLPQQPVTTSSLPIALNYPLLSVNYTPGLPFYFPGSCYTFPITSPICDPSAWQKDNKNGCACCQRRHELSSGSQKNSGTSCREDANENHRCHQGNDGTICNKKNCPSSINLQALVSQLLSLQGIVPCAASRIILKKIPGSDITAPIDETVACAQKSIGALNKDQLLAEARNAQQVNALINLHMTANPPSNIIPILTMVQLKVNVLKAQVENLVNQKIVESQSLGVTANNNLDPVVLSLKSDAELREILNALRQKESDERVSMNFAPYHSQRIIAEARLTNLQSKISQVEDEMERRRNNALPRTPLRHLPQNIPNFGSAFGTTFYTLSESAYTTITAPDEQNYQSPNPFIIQVRSPRKLYLKPHVGSPETTYASKTRQAVEPRCTCSPDDAEKGENEENTVTSGKLTCQTQESIDEINKELDTLRTDAENNVGMHPEKNPEDSNKIVPKMYSGVGEEKLAGESQESNKSGESNELSTTKKGPKGICSGESESELDETKGNENSRDWNE